jgi:hypothetical protein
MLIENRKNRKGIKEKRAYKANPAHQRKPAST